MYCELCTKWKSKANCKTLASTPACSEFVLNLQNISKRVIKFAEDFKSLSRKEARKLMALLDASLRLKKYDLEVGIWADYEFDGEIIPMKLISASKDGSAQAIGYKDDRLIPIMTKRTVFYDAFDKYLISCWDIMYNNSTFKTKKQKKKLILIIWNKLGNKNFRKMLKLKGIKHTENKKKLLARVLELI